MANRIEREADRRKRKTRHAQEKSGLMNKSKIGGEAKVNRREVENQKGCPNGVDEMPK